MFDDAASALWSVLTGIDDAVTAFERIAARYDVDEPRFHTDLEAFARRCVAEGLLEHAGSSERVPAADGAVASPSARARAVVPRTLRALTSLVATQRALARDGFARTYDRYALLPAAADAVPLREALSAFGRAENFFVARRAPDDCLARSLALYRFLRSAGVCAVHVIGVRRFPFAAHAWVECDGAEVLATTSCGFTQLARIGDPPQAPAAAS